MTAFAGFFFTNYLTVEKFVLNQIFQNVSFDEIKIEMAG